MYQVEPNVEKEKISEVREKEKLNIGVEHFLCVFLFLQT